MDYMILEHILMFVIACNLILSHKLKIGTNIFYHYHLSDKVLYNVCYANFPLT